MLGYSNGSIGYLPDAHEIRTPWLRGCAVPQIHRAIPLYPESGPALVEGVAAGLKEIDCAG